MLQRNSASSCARCGSALRYACFCLGVPPSAPAPPLAAELEAAAAFADPDEAGASGDLATFVLFTRSASFAATTSFGFGGSFPRKENIDFMPFNNQLLRSAWASVASNFRCTRSSCSPCRSSSLQGCERLYAVD